jgi:hypothetical protein
MKRLVIGLAVLCSTFVVLQSISAQTPVVAQCADPTFAKQVSTDLAAFGNRVTTAQSSLSSGDFAAARVKLSKLLDTGIQLRHKYEDTQNAPAGCETAVTYTVTAIATLNDTLTYGLLAIDNLNDTDYQDGFKNSASRVHSAFENLRAAIPALELTQDTTATPTQ